MKRLPRSLLQLALLVLPALALYAWQTRDLLPAGERLSAPAFELPDLDGRRHATTELAGRPAVLYFFAPWCTVCAASAPQLRWFDRLSAGRVRVVLVALDYDSPAEVAAWAARHDLSLPVLLGTPAVATAYRIRGFPTYYVLDGRGRIAGRDLGVSTLPGLWWRTAGLGG